MIKYDNCKDCCSKCVHAGKDREFVCPGGVSCKVVNKNNKSISELEILAALDNLRIMNPNDDYILRVATAVVARAFGYENRAEWTEKLDESGLVEYGIYDNIDKARENYNSIMKKLERSK